MVLTLIKMLLKPFFCCAAAAIQELDHPTPPELMTGILKLNEIHSCTLQQF